MCQVILLLFAVVLHLVLGLLFMSLWLFCVSLRAFLFLLCSFCIFVVALRVFFVTCLAPPPAGDAFRHERTRTVFPHYMVVLFKEIILKKLYTDKKMKEEKGQRPAQRVCLCACVCLLWGVLQTAVCSNRKWAVSLNLLP